MSRREISLRVEECPHCSRPHGYVIEVTLRPKANARAAVARVLVAVACAIDGRAYRTQIDVPVVQGQEFVDAQFARYGQAA